MTEENGMGFDTSALTPKPSRKKRSSSSTPVEKVEEVSIEEEIVEEAVVVEETPAPEPAPEPVVAKPWKPLVRPLKKSSGDTGPSRGEMRRTR